MPPGPRSPLTPHVSDQVLLSGLHPRLGAASVTCAHGEEVCNGKLWGCRHPSSPAPEWGDFHVIRAQVSGMMS